jgi:hypothetical protein
VTAEQAVVAMGSKSTDFLAGASISAYVTRQRQGLPEPSLSVLEISESDFLTATDSQDFGFGWESEVRKDTLEFSRSPAVFNIRELQGHMSSSVPNIAAFSMLTAAFGALTSHDHRTQKARRIGWLLVALRGVLGGAGYADPLDSLRFHSLFH